MSRALPPLTWFRAFEASARHLSFTAAAEELHLTQSAISQQVKSLEIRFGVRLFQRLPRGLALTDEARRLLPEVVAALGLLADIAGEYELRDSERLLTVAASVSFIEWIIAPALPRLQADHPGLELRLISTVWPDDFRAAHADVEIRFGSAALVGKGAERLQPDELLLVASPALAVDPARLAEYPLIETVGTADDWALWSKATGAGKRLRPSLFVDYHGAALDLAVAGAGIALTSSLLAAPCLADGSLARIGGDSIPARDGYFLATGSTGSSLARVFSDWLKTGLKVTARPAGRDRID